MLSLKKKNKPSIGNKNTESVTKIAIRYKSLVQGDGEGKKK